MRELVLASRNRGKLKEFAELFSPLEWRLRPVSDFCDVEPEETAATFVENALIKARHACDVSGLPALADDSGLVVPSLKGEPGVRSARYAGSPSNDEQNNLRLLRELDARNSDRTAYFVCVLVLMHHSHDPLPWIATDRWNGKILTATRGANGFGYDPLFFDESLGKSAAELTPAEKAIHSHRGRATRSMLDLMRLEATAP